MPVQKITSLQNAYIKELGAICRSSEARQKSGRVVVPGETLVSELGSHSQVDGLLGTCAALLEKLGTGRSCYLVSPEVMAKATGLSTPPKVAADVVIPTPSNLRRARKVVILDGIADPGNAGTIVRTALAFGWDGVFFSNDSVDPFNDKVLRSSRAALFHLPYASGPLSPDLWEGATLLIADLEGTPVQEVKVAGPTRLVVSHETRGPSNAIRKQGIPVTLPMKGAMESLNVAVAAGVLLYCFCE